MPTVIQDLSKELKEHFSITEIHRSSSGGQKHVFIVTKKGEKCAMKLFHNFGKREIRELAVYEKFKDLEGLPKVLSIEDYGSDKIVFEAFIDGPNVQEIIGDFAGDADKIKALLRDICTILKPIWDDGKIHRDLKASNIMLSSEGKVVVIDFGIMLDLNGTVYTAVQPNSWDYASPEQILNKRDLIDYRSDFFSMAVLAYTLYYQQRPFGNTQDEVTERFSNKNLSYHTDAACPLNRLFSEALQYLPADRPRDMDAFLATL